MVQLFIDDGLLFCLKQIANAAGAGMYWQLYTSNTTPAKSDTLATYTLASSTYFRSQQAVGNFTLQQVAADIGTIQAPNVVFTNGSGSPVTVYGYVIYEPTGSKLVAAARFDSAPITIAAGGTLVVTPILGDADESTI
jgi:hypothetical protein